MPKLDLFTVEICTSLNTLLAGCGLLLVSTLNRRTDGVKRCAFSCLFFLIGFALYPARLIIPGKWIIFLPNFLVFAGMVVLLDGVRAFRGLRRPTGFLIAGTLAYTSGLWFWLYVRDDINMRTVVEMLTVAVWAFLLAASLSRNVPRGDRRVYWPTAGIMAVQGIATCIKAIDAVGGPTIQFWTPRPTDFIFAGMLNLCIVGCAFGLSIAINLKLQRETEALALYDSVTQLPNRRFFEEKLEVAEKRAFESGCRIALVYCDLDDFKGINDVLGHEGGDAALKLVGDRLQGAVDKNVCLARVGGDEFLLLVENAPSRAEIHALIDRVTKSVEGEFEFNGKSASVRISCGLAIYPEDVGSVSDLIRLADAAMYVMKQHGRSVPAAVEQAMAGFRA